MIAVGVRTEDRGDVRIPGSVHDRLEMLRFVGAGIDYRAVLARTDEVCLRAREGVGRRVRRKDPRDERLRLFGCAGGPWAGRNIYHCLAYGAATGACHAARSGRGEV